MKADRSFWLFHLSVSGAAVGIWATGLVQTTALLWGFVIVYNLGWAGLGWRRPSP